MQLQPGTVLGGRYQLDRKLGQGGMGSVFAALDLQLRRNVAVKVLGDAAQGSRFELEARTVAGLQHPNIATLFDFHAGPPTPFLVMELVEGENLRGLVNRERQLPVPRAVHLTVQVLAALAVAHRAGTIHRDVKPSNVMILPGDHVKLVDFGVAKVAAGVTRQHLTADGSVIGTLQFMPPEQAAGQAVTPAVDVYAAGVCLFEMLAGYNPFAVGDVGAVFLAVRDRIPPDLRQLRPDVPAPVALAVARALAKDPRARFGSAGEFAAALGAGAQWASYPSAGPALATGGAPTSFGGPPSMTAAGPPSFAQGPGPLATAPARAGTGLKLLVAGLVLALLATATLAVVLATRAPEAAPAAAATAAASGAAAPASTAGVTPAGPASAVAQRSAAKPGPAPAATKKPPSSTRCACAPDLSQHPPDDTLLCVALRKAPFCSCARNGVLNELLCSVPMVLVDRSWTCPNDTNHNRDVPGGRDGATCSGYFSDPDGTTRQTGTLTCDLCGSRNFAGNDGESCEGFAARTGGKFRGTLRQCN